MTSSHRSTACVAAAGSVRAAFTDPNLKPWAGNAKDTVQADTCFSYKATGTFRSQRSNIANWNWAGTAKVQRHARSALAWPQHCVCTDVTWRNSVWQCVARTLTRGSCNESACKQLGCATAGVAVASRFNEDAA